MRRSFVAVLLFVMSASVPAIGQGKTQEPGKAAHETVIDGRWELKSLTEKDPAMTFEFKNESGVLTGIVIQDKNPPKSRMEHSKVAI
jgi:hypothetical protein